MQLLTLTPNEINLCENDQAYFCIVKITDITEKTWSNLN